MTLATALTTTQLPLKLVARGKVRDVYDAGLTEGEHAGALLFVATDRISAFDVILENVSGSEGLDHVPALISCFTSCTLGHPAKGKAAPCTLDILV